MKIKCWSSYAEENETLLLRVFTHFKALDLQMCFENIFILIIKCSLKIKQNKMRIEAGKQNSIQSKRL